MNSLIPSKKVTNVLKINSKFIILLILFGFIHWKMSYAEVFDIREYQVKAVFWYNFTKFVTWPPSTFTDAQTSLRMCVLGDDPFRGEMDLAVKNLTSHDHLIEIKYVSILDIKDCHTLFISHSEHEQLSSIFSKLNKIPVLTVSDINGFTKQGGMIEFYHEDNKIRFMIEHKVLLDSGLKAHAQLLKISKIVQRTQ